MVKPSMSTVDKALRLLRHFSVQFPELGLSELARLSGNDKTTTLRCLTALERNGFVEQDSVTRKYRIGFAPINFAQIREQNFPTQSVIARYLEELATELGETAHGSLIVGQDLMTAAIAIPDRTLFAHLDPSTLLPWHATASGLAILAHLPDESRDALLPASDFTAFAERTPACAKDLEPILIAARQSGIAQANSTYEDEITGTAAPIFGAGNVPVGAIAIAAVSMRLTPDLDARIRSGLKAAARAISRDLGAAKPTTAAHLPEDA